ncbi:hypothetical protein [Candidatus Hodarchaeum mangrovi]
MEKTLRIRNKSFDVELTFWKLLPIIFLLIMLFLSSSLASANPAVAPPAID